MSDLRERLIDAGAHGLDPQPWQRVGQEEAHRHDEVAAAVVNAAMPIIEAELQKRDQEKARRIDQFKRLAQAERVEADKLPRDAFYRPIKAEHIGASNAYLVAAQMLEEPKP